MTLNDKAELVVDGPGVIHAIGFYEPEVVDNIGFDDEEFKDDDIDDMDELEELTEEELAKQTHPPPFTAVPQTPKNKLPEKQQQYGCAIKTMKPQ
jgi:hypothetical protein